MHSFIFKSGFDLDKYVGNTLLKMYGDFNEIGLSQKVFDEMHVRDVVSWSSLLAAYSSWYPAFKYEFITTILCHPVFKV